MRSADTKKNKRKGGGGGIISEAKCQHMFQSLLSPSAPCIHTHTQLTLVFESPAGLSSGYRHISGSVGTQEHQSSLHIQQDSRY